MYEIVWESHALEPALERIRADGERDLRPLLSQFVAHEDAREAATALLE